MRDSFLQCFVERAGNHIRLLLRRQLDEIHRITGYADGQLGIFLRMLLCVQQRFAVQNVYVQMMAAFSA